ncbi:N-acetyltransferase family protein [Altererythrobacter sp. MF3-039]|uniref:GNAT family N-acetyltransferase n=1 Tax=Altererythrobacter sp. MF3-039 TaxID=3252901 RepID=UPI00390CB9E8
MILRPASLDDVKPLAKLGRDSFCDKFEHLYDPKDLNVFLEEVYSEKSVAEEIAGPECIHQLAEDASGLIGYCKMRVPSWYEDDSDAQNPIALGQLYTAPGKTGLGIGAALMEWALALSRERGRDAIQLSVWSENFGAQRFYERYGFKKIADIDFYVGNHRDDEFLYELRLD